MRQVQRLPPPRQMADDHEQHRRHGEQRARHRRIDLDQQGDPTTAGGEQQYWSGTLLEDPTGRQIQIPTFKNAKTITIPLYYDPSKPWYPALKTVDAKGEPVVLRAKLAGGDVLYWYGYLSYDGDPTMAANTPMGTTATFTALADSILVEAA